MAFDGSKIQSAMGRAIFGTALELQSPLTPPQCHDELRLNTDPYWKFFGNRPVIGWLRNNKFTGYRRIYYGNSFRTRVLALFEDNGNGSRIVLRFGVNPFAQAFMAFWFTGVLGIGGTIFIFGLQAAISGSEPVGNWISLVVPPLMVAFGIGFYKFGRWLARNEQAFLLDFIMTTLKARLAIGRAGLHAGE